VLGSAGMVTPSHFVPLAAPGMVALGLKWMWNPESPFYIKPRLDAELFGWGLKFWRAANPGQVERAAPLLRDLTFASRALFEEFAASTDDDFSLVTKGLLMLCKAERTLDEESKYAERANQLGVPAQVLDAKQTAVLEPAIRMDIAGSVFFPKDCHLSPNRFMVSLQTQCEKLGVQFHWRTGVSGLTQHTSHITSVRTSSGEIEADEFVLAGGSWSPLLVRDLGLKLPIQAGKGYSLTLPKPRFLPTLCAILTEARVAMTPMCGSLRFGGTMEIAGLNEDINPRRVQGIIKAACRYIPDLTPQDFEGIPPWRGLRPCSPDGLPYLGRTRRFDNLTIASGHAMMGLSLGPISGTLVAEILSGPKLSIDLTLLDPDRYA
jgi:D-amino-acid dehydrogenase